MWSVSADPVDFDEAIAWFRARVPLTKDEWERLQADAKRRAFTVANVAQLELVADVWKAVDEAIANGTTLEEFVDAIGDKLLAAWGDDVEDAAFRLETIFRTNVQLAYAAGRFRQATDPAVAAARPFWMYNAVLDSRTTPICRAADGTVLPADHPWWKEHSPPCHFNCRAGVMTLTEAQAKKFGVTEHPTDLEAASGFGAEPGSEEFEPDLKQVPPPLAAEYKKKARKKPPPATEPPKGLQVGKHIEKIAGKLTKKRLDELLKTIDDQGTLAFLEKTPLAQLGLRAQARIRVMEKWRLVCKRVNGWWSPAREIDVTVARKVGTFGQPWEAGASWSISTAAKDAAEATLRTFVHELGHHIHLAGHDPRLDAIVRAAFDSPKKNPITRYAATSSDEYFAESFAAYRFARDELEQYDPVGFKMVEDVLRARGILPPETNA